MTAYAFFLWGLALIGLLALLAEMAALEPPPWGDERRDLDGSPPPAHTQFPRSKLLP